MIVILSEAKDLAIVFSDDARSLAYARDDIESLPRSDPERKRGIANYAWDKLARFFASLASYLTDERPSVPTEHVFVVLKGPHRGNPLTAAGLDEIVRGACQRAGISKLTCHQLRHTCLTRLREAGMALEAVQAQAGHRSIESTPIYLHLTDSWLANEYRHAVDAIEANSGNGPEVVS